MGSKKSLYIVWFMIYISFSPFVQGLDGFNPFSLDDFFRDYTNNSIQNPRTGILYNISLPSNFSGMEVSIVRLRSRNFWTRGANFSSFQIPPRILPTPFVKRIAIVYQNLGNWSSYYYNLPNYTLVSPVLGFMAFNAIDSKLRVNETIEFVIKEDPILVHFPRIVDQKGTNATLKCVRFGKNGSVELTNMTLPNVCVARGQGHFSIVVWSPPMKKKKGRFWKWWVIGFGAGLGGLVLVGLVGVLVYKWVRWKRIGKMERQSERSENLETTWVGMSKMPSATGIRTQPVIENEYVP